MENLLFEIGIEQDEEVAMRYIEEQSSSGASPSATLGRARTKKIDKL